MAIIIVEEKYLKLLRRLAAMLSRWLLALYSRFLWEVDPLRKPIFIQQSRGYWFTGPTDLSLIVHLVASNALPISLWFAISSCLCDFEVLDDSLAAYRLVGQGTIVQRTKSASIPAASVGHDIQLEVHVDKSLIPTLLRAPIVRVRAKPILSLHPLGQQQTEEKAVSITLHIDKDQQ